MAVLTRIKNNQVTDASAGNVYLGVNAAAKVQDFSITGGKIQNNLTYGSDLTITGNLTVQGNTTTIDTVNLVVEDPLILLAKEQTGSPTLDIGFIGKRGTSNNIAWVWDESANSFVSVFTTSEVTNTTISIASYAAVTMANLSATTGNFSGNVQAANLSVVGNVTGSGAVFSGNVTASNFIGNISGNIDAAGSNTQVQFNDGDLLGASSNFTFDKATNILAVGGQITSTGAGNAATGTGQIFLNGATLNRIDYNTNGTGAPAFTTRSNGTKVTLYPALSGSTTDYALGIDTATMWSSIPEATSGFYFKWYGATTEIANLSGTGIFSATGNIIGANILTSGYVTATGNVTGGNVNTGGAVSATGNVNSGNVNTGIMSASGNVIGGNVSTAGLVTATGNVTGGNVNTGGVVSATGNVNSGNVNTGIVSASGNVNSGNVNTAIVSASGNVTGANLVTGGLITATGNINGANVNTARVASTGGITISSGGSSDIALSAGGNINADSNYINNLLDPVQNQDAATKVYVDNLVATGLTYHESVLVSTTANLATTTGGTITYAQPNGAGNGIGATITTTGSFNLIDTANVQTAGTRILVKDEGNAVLNGVYTWSNATVITRSTDADQYGIDSSQALSLNSYFFTESGNVNKGSAYVLTEPTSTITFGSSNIVFDLFSTSQVYSANTQAGLILVGTVFAAKVDSDTTAFDGGGNISVRTGANLNLGTVSASGNITGANLNTGGLVTATGNVTGGNVNTGGAVSATGNVNSGNVNTAIVSASGNVTGANLVTGGLVTATGNVTGGNILTGGLISATGNITGANLILTSGTIDGPAAGRITVNASDLDTDFAIDGDSTPNVFYVDAGLGTTSFGNSGAIANAIVSFNTTNSIRMPIGNTAQRPDPAAIGMTRFSTAVDALEVYTSGGWETVGVPAFTVITDDQFAGTGACTTFTLSEDSTTAATIVSINGVVQIPTTAYSVTGNSLVFTEAPEVSDVIDARLLTTTTTVVSIENVSGNAVIETLDTAATVQVTGNILPVTSNTYNLGSSSLRWNDLFLQGSTITLGNVVIKNTSGNTIGFFGPDGTTAGSIDTNNIDSAGISNGNSSFAVIASGGNIRANVGGATILQITSAGIINGQGNGVGNIGNATGFFNTIFAKATSAQYADLAEMYVADCIIEPGTVVCFGGDHEITICDTDSCSRVAGVVSTNPSYIMNAGLEGDHVVAVALTGRVPTRVTGQVRKGDMMVSTRDGRARACSMPAVGQVIGKALADFDGTDGVIEVVVGRL